MALIILVKVMKVMISIGEGDHIDEGDDDIDEGDDDIDDEGDDIDEGVDNIGEGDDVVIDNVLAIFLNLFRCLRYFLIQNAFFAPVHFILMRVSVL